MDTLPTLLLGLLTVVAAIFAVKFDLNQYLKGRRKQKEDKLRLMCPHVHLAMSEDDRPMVRSAYVSPPGTLEYHCELCGRSTYDGDEPRRNALYWAKNPTQLLDRHKEMRKLAKRLGR